MVKQSRNNILKLNQEEFFALSVNRMRYVFPAEERFVSIYSRDKTQVQCPQDESYLYFSGPFYIQHGFIESEMISNLQNGARMLSVGAGEGHLEKLLHLGLDIPKSSISIADYPYIHPRVKDFGFKKYIFDMLGNWPKFKTKFDYIIFPESLTVALCKIGKDDLTYRFYDTIKHITNQVQDNNFSEISTADSNFFLDLVEQDVPIVKTKYQVILSALDNLTSKGEIRFSGGIKHSQQKAYLKLKLKQDYPNLKYPRVHLENQFIIQKE